MAEAEAIAGKQKTVACRSTWVFPMSPSHLQEAVEKVARFRRIEQPAELVKEKPKSVANGAGESEERRRDTVPEPSLSVPTVTGTVMSGQGR